MSFFSTLAISDEALIDKIVAPAEMFGPDIVRKIHVVKSQTGEIKKIKAKGATTSTTFVGYKSKSDETESYILRIAKFKKEIDLKTASLRLDGELGGANSRNITLANNEEAIESQLLKRYLAVKKDDYVIMVIVKTIGKLKFDSPTAGDHVAFMEKYLKWWDETR